MNKLTRVIITPRYLYSLMAMWLIQTFINLFSLSEATEVVTGVLRGLTILASGVFVYFAFKDPMTWAEVSEEDGI